MNYFGQFVIGACFTLIAGSAQAGLEICNDTRDVQGISIGYKGDTDWTSEGWWNIDPGSCSTVVGGDLKKRYYYLRAEVEGGNFTGGGFSFCTTPEEYTIVGDTECESRGYATEDFIEIDTGETAKEYTYRITQSDMDAAQSTSESGSGLGLTFCNETPDTQAISVGYKGDEGFTSEGWWNVDAGECVTPIGGALKTRYYYYRTEVNGADFPAAENYHFCTTPEAYTIVGEKDCDARGYDREAFAEIDTGESAKGFTFTLGATAAPDTSSETSGSDVDFGLRFCNDTTDIQSVSVGYEGADGWTSEGWWNVDPDGCTNVLPGPLQKQYYYYRAEVDGGEFDGENYTFCTTPEAYTIVGDSDCEARGYDAEKFREINVGSGITAYTLTLVAPPGSKPDSGDTGRTTNETAVDDMSDVGAGLEICNETSDVQSISLGYEGAEGWTSEGWWVADPGECVTPTLDGKARRYFYYRAEVDAGDFSGQSYFFCTTPEEYTIVGDSDCESRGYDREDFAEIDTGGTDGLFTFTMVSDGGSSKPAPADPVAEEPKGTVPEGVTPKGGGLDFDRQGAADTPAQNEGTAEPVAEPEPVVEPEPEPEPMPEPELVIEPDPVPEVPKPPRRGGSRGG